MSFKVGWIFHALNKTKPVAKEIKKDFDAIGTAADNSTAKIEKKNRILRNLKARLLTARRSMRRFRSESNLNSKALGFLKGKMQALVVLFAAGLGIGKIIQEGTKLQESIAGLSAITGQSGKGLASMKKEVKELAVATGILPSEVAIAFTQVASAKSELLDTEGAVAKVTEQSLLLAKAAGIEIPDAVRASVGALNQFGAGADQASRFVNVIAAGSKVGASQVGETAEALKNVGAVASSFGVGFEETNSLLQVFAKNEIKGAEAGTKLRGVLLALETKSKGKLQPSILGVVGALKKLRDMNLDNSQMAKLFGAENITGALILRKNIPLVEQWTKELTGTSVATRQAAIMNSTFNSGLTSMKVNLVTLASGIFDSALPGLNALSGTVGFFIKSLDQSDVEAFGILLSGLGVIASALSATIGVAFKLIMVVVKPVIAVLKGIGDIIGQIVGAIATLNFSNFDLSESFSLGGATLGLFGGDAQSKPAISEQVSSQNSTTTLNGQITVGATAPATVESVSAESFGGGGNFNLGFGAASG